MTAVAIPDQRQERHGASEEPRHRREVRTSAVRGFRPDIEGLRAVAVLLVVLYHAGLPWLPGGYIGVDVFLVISGYLITTHLLREIRQHGRIRFTHFYARRARRLLPLAALVVLTTLAASWLLTSALSTRQTATDALWTSLLAMNIHLANSGVDYQANTDPSPLQHFWSLAVEEQFYLAWPVILALTAALAAAAARRSTRASTHTTTAVIAVIAVIAASSFAYSYHQTAVAQALAYFATPARAWELAVGALVAAAAPTLAHQRWLQNGWLAWAGLVAIVIPAVVYTDQTSFPGVAALLPVAGAAAVVVSGLDHATNAERTLLGQPLAQGIGKISYGLYLWHWPMLVLAPAYFDTDSLTLAQGLGVVTVAAWLAVATYIVVETPLRTLPALLRPLRALGAAAAATAVVVTASLSAAALAPDATGTGAAASSLTGATVSEIVTLSAGRLDVPSNLTPTIDRAHHDAPDRTVPGAESCHANLLVSQAPTGADQCVFGDPDSTTTVVLTGDSHAFQWLPALERVASERGWRLVSITKGACPLYDTPIVNQTLKRDYTECYAWREGVGQRIAAERPAMVVTTGAIFNSRGEEFTRSWIAGVGTTVRTLRATGTEVAVLADTPYLRGDVPKCLAENLSSASTCGISWEEGHSDPERRAGTTTAATAAGATVVDPAGWLCTAQECPPIIGDTLVYRDNSHLTSTFARTIAGNLAAALPQVGEGLA